MRSGRMPKPGDVVLAYVQFADSFEVKVRPALVIITHATIEMVTRRIRVSVLDFCKYLI